MVGWNSSGDPETDETSDLCKEWEKFVLDVLEENHVLYRHMKFSSVELESFDGQEHHEWLRKLRAQGFELRRLQYQINIYYKKITGRPPSENAPLRKKAKMRTSKPRQSTRSSERLATKRQRRLNPQS